MLDPNRINCVLVEWFEERSRLFKGTLQNPEIAETDPEEFTKAEEVKSGRCMLKIFNLKRPSHLNIEYFTILKTEIPDGPNMKMQKLFLQNNVYTGRVSKILKQRRSILDQVKRVVEQLFIDYPEDVSMQSVSGNPLVDVSQFDLSYMEVDESITF